MFRIFETILDPTAEPPAAPPPDRLGPFYWHFIRQSRFLVIALLAAGMLTAVLDSMIPAFIGRLVTLATNHPAAELWSSSGSALLGMAAIILIARPAALLLLNLITNQATTPNLTNLVRWQSHWNVVRQSWSFFQNDFAGRIANRVMQAGPALRESVVSATNAVWYIIVYGGSAIILMGRADWRLAVPMVIWFATYAVALRFYVPVMRNRSRTMSEMRSTLTGRVVDSYTNILTVKLFASARDEDAHVAEAVADHTSAFRRQLRLITVFTVTLATLNASLMVGTGGVAVWLLVHGAIQAGAVATALPLAWQISSAAGWVAQNVTAIFENVGVVQDGMRSIAVPRQHPDAPGARSLQVTRGAIRFEHVHFGYGTARGVLHDLDLDIRPGERIGLIGTSGAGKSTLVNLLLGFYALEQGRILIDGQDIAGVSQESLRRQIAMVTQDTSLLHRSVADNIRYGRPTASDAEVLAAAERAHAAGFIETLEDWNGRHGMEAHVGERGVKLSGGQRQRVAIARVILKDAPILVLDEATSALDSEVEAAIQEQLDGLMQGRTVIAIAHRLSTIVQMDRLIVLDQGRIVEQGSHAELLAAGGAYASLWKRQSAGLQVAHVLDT